MEKCAPETQKLWCEQESFKFVKITITNNRAEKNSNKCRQNFIPNSNFL